MSNRYYVSRDSDGSVTHLVRICETDTALWGEYYRAGTWHEDAAVLAYLTDGSLGAAITEEEAVAIADAVEAKQSGMVSTASPTGRANGDADGSWASGVGALAAEERALLDILVNEKARREGIPITQRALISRTEKYAFAIGLDVHGDPFPIPPRRDLESEA